MSFAKVGFTIALFLITGCGFQPIYYTPKGEKSVQSLTAQVQILPIPEETGRIMVQSLKSALNPENLSVEKKFSLSVRLNQHINTDQGILNDNTSTRATMTMTAYYVLKDKNGREIINDKAIAMESYNILTTPYSTVTAEQASQKRLIKLLSEKISLRLANYFKKTAHET